MQFRKGYRTRAYESLEVLQGLLVFFWGKYSWSLSESNRSLWSLFEKVKKYRCPRIWLLSNQEDIRLGSFWARKVCPFDLLGQIEYHHSAHCENTCFLMKKLEAQCTKFGYGAWPSQLWQLASGLVAPASSRRSFSCPI